MLKILLDANIYFAGIHSSKGGSSLILQLAYHKKIQVFSTQLILKEAERNLLKKTSQKNVRDFHNYLKKTKLRMLPALSDKILSKYEPNIYPKDVPILAATVEAKLDYLITLDRRHFLIPKVISASKKLKIMTPGNFLGEKQVLYKILK